MSEEYINPIKEAVSLKETDRAVEVIRATMEMMDQRELIQLINHGRDCLAKAATSEFSLNQG